MLIVHTEVLTSVTNLHIVLHVRAVYHYKQHAGGESCLTEQLS